ncbi:MAG TPA: hypothetical protein VKR27_00270, partial [Acidimicrobiales bacterium]|nr:hypothetical protein [Acidimicrobiales bacterium]
RIGTRLRVSEAMLGLIAALAANAPEITSSVSALAGHQTQISAGVILGSNVFNLAALLGIGALVARRITVHRRVVSFTGAIAVWSGGVCLATVLGAMSASVGLALVLVVLVPYGVLAATHGRLPGVVPSTARIRRFLATVVREEEQELHESIVVPPARQVDVAAAIGALIVVVLASVVMERSASRLGVRFAVPAIVVGGIVLAAVTSLPNAVAGVYLAKRGRGAASFSTAFNSNALNIAIGYLLPATIIGIGTVSAHVTLVASWYLAMAVGLVVATQFGAGVSRRIGAMIVVAYAAFVIVLILTT